MSIDLERPGGPGDPAPAHAADAAPAHAADADSPATCYAEANGIRLAYEAFGDPGDPLILLIMGLGTQMIAWPDPLCRQLAGAGYRVVRYDNRDIGLSTHLDGLRAPTPVAVSLRRARPPYTVDDMADDAAALIAALGSDSAHVVGASMGGFIAQLLAVRHPDVVRSLTLIMTSTGSRRVGYPRPSVLLRLLRGRSGSDREAVIDGAVAVFRTIGSPGFPFDEAALRVTAGRSFERGYDPKGYLRQLAAIIGQADRTASLRSLNVPTVVVHGLSDPLVHPSGGLALARAIPGARFVGFAGMGHDLPQPLWGPVAEEILSVVAAGQARAAAA